MFQWKKWRVPIIFWLTVVLLIIFGFIGSRIFEVGSVIGMVSITFFFLGAGIFLVSALLWNDPAYRHPEDR